MNKDFDEMLAALSGAGAEYLVVGAHALAVHGHPRATGDLDIWVHATADNASRVMTALRAFGAPLMGLQEEDLAMPGNVFQMGVPPRRIDILTAISGVSFMDAWPHRHVVTLGGMAVPFLGREQLLANKRAAARPKDLADAALLSADPVRPAPRRSPRRGRKGR